MLCPLWKKLYNSKAVISYFQLSCTDISDTDFLKLKLKKLRGCFIVGFTLSTKGQDTINFGNYYIFQGIQHRDNKGNMI